MEKIFLSRNFLKKPGYAIAILLFAVFLVEALSWLYAYERKVVNVRAYGGVLGYIWILLRGAILPEIVTLYIIINLINFYHSLLRIRSVRLSWAGIIRYELLFVPVVLIAFFLFNPITQTVRFLLVEFPNYDLSQFIDNSILGTYSLRYYSMYLLPVFIMVYSTINLSLVNDLIRAGRNWRANNMALD